MKATELLHAGRLSDALAAALDDVKKRPTDTAMVSRTMERSSLKLLAGLTPLLRHEVARRMRMRVIPELRFIFDDSVERGLHMDAVIDSLHVPKSEPHDT